MMHKALTSGARISRMLFPTVLLSTLFGCDARTSQPALDTATASHAGGVVCLKPQYYAGLVREGSIVSHVFHLVNHGDVAHNIASVKKNCSCLDAKPSQKVIEPGASCEVRVSFAVGRAPDTATTSAEVYLDGLEEPITLEVGARVRPHLQVVPSSLHFGQLEFSDHVSRKLRVQQTSKEAPTLERARANPDLLDVAMQRVTQKAPHTWIVTVSLLGKSLTSSLTAHLVLIRSDGEMMSIPVRAQPSWGFEIRPARPVMVIDGGAITRHVTVHSRDGLPFIITKTRSTPSILNVHVSSRNEPKLMHELELTTLYSPAGPDQFGEGRVDLAIESPTKDGHATSKLSIPVSILRLSDRTASQNVMPLQ